MRDLESAVQYDPAIVERFVDLGHWNDERVTDWVEAWAQRTPDKVAIVGADGQLTYAETWDRSVRLANGLRGLGLGEGDVIAQQLPNIPDFLIAYYATQLIGGITCLIHMPYRSGELEPLLRHAGACTVICNAASPNYDAPATMLGLKERLPAVEHIIVADGPAPAGTHALAEIEKRGDRTPVMGPRQGSAPSLLGFTSGTKLKHLLRKAQARTPDAICQAIGTHLDAFTPQECANYFRNSGYKPT